MLINDKDDASLLEFWYDAVISTAPFILKLNVGGPNIVSVLKGNGIVISVNFSNNRDKSSVVIPLNFSSYNSLNILSCVCTSFLSRYSFISITRGAFISSPSRVCLSITLLFSPKITSVFINDEFSSNNGCVFSFNFIPYEYSGLYWKYFIRAVESTGSRRVESIANPNESAIFFLIESFNSYL